MAILPFLILVVISSSSYLYGISHYVFDEPHLEAETIDAIRWVFHNAPKDSTVLVNEKYEIAYAFSTISIHKTITLKEFNDNYDESLLEDFITSNNIKYTYGIDNPVIFQKNGYELNYINEINSPLAKLVQIENKK